MELGEGILEFSERPCVSMRRGLLAGYIKATSLKRKNPIPRA